MRLPNKGYYKIASVFHWLGVRHDPEFPTAQPPSQNQAAFETVVLQP